MATNAQRVMIKCPTTKKPVFTTITSLPGEVWKTLKIEGMSLTCPLCRQTHAWSKKDAYLEAEN